MSHLSRIVKSAMALAFALPSIGSARADELIGGGYGSLLVSAPFAVALGRGEFEKHGVQITGIISHSGGGTGVRNLLAGELPFGDISTAAVIAAHKQGADVRIVSASCNGLDLVWVALPKSDVQTINDLIGKKVGVTNPKSSSETLAKMAFEQAGISLDKVSIVATGGMPAGLAALDAGGVDVAMIIEPVWSARKNNYRPVFDVSSLPPMTHSVGVTTARYAKANPEKLRGIIAARRAAVDFIYAEPEEAARLIAAAYGESLPVNIAIAAVKNLVAIRYWSPGNIEIDKLNAMLKGLERQGEWSGPPPWDTLVDRSFLPEDMKK
jgi:NitT/TauT family transport system substrate-binding protein